MNTNGNLAAPLGALALLGTGFIILVAAIFLVHSLSTHNRARARVILILTLAVVGVYLATTLIFSFASHENVLARGAEKHFCELDCHLAYSIVEKQMPPDQSNPRGPYSITIKTRFDETTVSPKRGEGLLYPNSRVLTLIDQSGNRFKPSSQSGTSLSTPLRPGESYTTQVVFDLPPESKPAALLISEGDWITSLVIGHENSLLHKQTKFQL